ncbi:MAG: hypothetical protein N2316_03155 [Spirochaetes bacterium]|nr:hypothetical protein [Spirochaetota bacterium]
MVKGKKSKTKSIHSSTNPQKNTKTNRAKPSITKAATANIKKKASSRKPVAKKNSPSAQTAIAETNMPPRSETSNTSTTQPSECAVKKDVPRGADKYSIEVIEGPENRYFIIKVNNYRNFFALEEMRQIVKACHQAGNEKEGVQRLYHWFNHFRKDVLINTKIDGPHDPALKTIFNHLVSTYTVKGA